MREGAASGNHRGFLYVGNKTFGGGRWLVDRRGVMSFFFFFSLLQRCSTDAMGPMACRQFVCLRRQYYVSMVPPACKATFDVCCFYYVLYRYYTQSLLVQRSNKPESQTAVIHWVTMDT